MSSKATLRSLSGEVFKNFSKSVAPEQIHIEDIATGLSNVCRFSGQIPVFYSVAAHSILVSEWIERNGGTPQEALWGLLHDASESYIQDLPSPVKQLDRPYRKLESNFMRAVCDRFKLPRKMPAIVKRADKELLSQEKVFLELSRWINNVAPYANKRPKKAFLLRFSELGGTA